MSRPTLAELHKVREMIVSAIDGGCVEALPLLKRIEDRIAEGEALPAAACDRRT